jgi:hypothetical protein
MTITHNTQNEGQSPEVSTMIQISRAQYPKYEVNGKVMRDYNDARLYFSIYGGVMMEKLDQMTPWHVLQSTKSMS